MAPQHPISPQERDRGLLRLRRLTLGTAVASLAAVVGLGTLAAATHPGNTKTSTTSSTTQASTASSSSGTLQSPSTTPSSASSGTASATSGGS
jgi:hypothetical protein